MAYRSSVPGLDSSSGEENSDDESGVAWKRSRMDTNGSSSTTSKAPMEFASLAPAGGAVDSSKPRPRKRNNIWGSVMAEEVLTSSLTGSALNTYDRNRSVESYDYTQAFERDDEGDEAGGNAMFHAPKVSAKVRLGGPVKDTDMDVDRAAKPHSGSNTTVDDADIFETKEKVKDRLGEYEVVSNVKDRLGGKMTNVPNRERYRDSHEGGDNHFRKRPAHDRLGPKITDETMYSDVKKRLGVKPNSQTSNFRMGTTNYVELKSDDSLAKIVNGMTINLNEPKVDLMEKCVSTIGITKALELMYEVEMIEETGGLLTLSGHRRRTPGGIFFFLLRNDPSIDKAAITKIFKEDKEECNKKLNKKRRNHRKQEFSKTVDHMLVNMETEDKKQDEAAGGPVSSAVMASTDQQPSAAGPPSQPHPDDIFSTLTPEEGAPLPETDSFGVMKEKPKTAEDEEESESVDAGAAEASASTDAVDAGQQAEDAEGGMELEEGEIED